MKARIWKILKFLGLGLLVLVVVLAAVFAWLVKRAQPKRSGQLAVAGLSAPVEVIRDHWGVPHLYATNEHDLFLAQGYVHAQDRLWQMEFNRHVSSGTLAELLGPPLVETDRALRTFGMHRAAEEDWKVLDPATRAILEAYAAGVNAFLAQNRGKLPIEFAVLGADPKEWTPIDTLAWGKMMAFSLGQNHTQEVMRTQLAATVGPERAAQLLPPNPDSQLPIVTPAAGGYPALSAPSVPAPAKAAMSGPAPGSQRLLAKGPEPGGLSLLGRLLLEPGLARGSNNWVVHGSRTATGLPLLANDTHLDLGMPSAWYENGLHGGRFDVVGFSLPGVPMVVIGHNPKAAWGISNLCGDSQDLFVETLNDKKQYREGGAWKDLKVVRETIAVKGGKPQTLDVLWTSRGPLVTGVLGLDEGAPPMSLRWSAHQAEHNMDALARLDTAGDWASFRSALSLWGSPSLNFVYADVANNIGYQAAGTLPVRAAGQDGLRPVPAGDGDRDWQGTIPFDEMPKVLNPAEGFLVTANNRVVADGYPRLIGRDYADPFRSARIRERLQGLSKATVDDMKSVQADVHSLDAAALRPYLLSVQPANDLEKQALAEVSRWDLEFTKESAGASVYFAWFSTLLPEIVGDELGEDRMRQYRGFAINQTPMFTALLASPNDPWFDDQTTKDKVETRDDIVRRAFEGAVKMLSAKLGGKPAEWRWGRLHTAVLAHQPFGNSGIGPLISLFNGKPVSISGAPFTVNSTSAAPRRQYLAFFGVSQRLIVDLKDMSRALAINSTGQSGVLFDRHRDDQTPLWAAVQYRPMPFGKAAVDAEAENRLTLAPK